MTTTNDRRFCTELGPAPVRPGRRAAIRTDLQWVRGDTATVRFLEGSAALRARVTAVAREWTALGLRTLDLAFVEDGPADIRIAFRPGAGSWSAIGVGCRDIAAGSTMNFGWLTDDAPDSVLRPVVLHEFGHAIGLVHEHQNPQRPIAWNRDAVIADLSGPPNNWDVPTIERNVLTAHEPRSVLATDLDQFSIMMYPIPRAWTLDGFSSGFTTEISELDRELVRRAYAA